MNRRSFIKRAAAIGSGLYLPKAIGQPFTLGSYDFGKRTQFNSSSLITSGLLAWWKMDDGSGSSAADSSGNGNTGTLINSPTWTTGKINGGLQLTSASSQYVDIVGSSGVADNLDNFTVCCWFNMSGGPVEQMLVSKITNDTAAGWMILGGSGGQMLVFCVSGGGNYVGYDSTASTYADSNWHHIAFTFSGHNTIKLYMDGVADLATPDTGGTWSSNNFSNANTIRIGNDASSDGVYYNGIIDDVRIYNRALSSVEISNIFNNPGMY